MTTIDRGTGIGASEVPAILGLSPWRTPVAVWLEKVGLGGSQRTTGAMLTGRELERSILRIASIRDGERITHNQVTFRHPDWPRVPLYATPDGFGRRRWTAYEAKVVGHRFDDWHGGPPAYVAAQAQAQMACYPRLREVVVVALVGGDVRTYDVARDDEVGERIADDVAAWWADYVVREVAPPAQTDDDRWAVTRALIAPPPTRSTAIADDGEEVLAARLAALQAQALDVGRDLDSLRLEMAERTTDVDLAGDGWRASWSIRRTVDWRAVADYERTPQRVIDRFTTETPTFTFRRTAGSRPMPVLEALP